MYAGLMNKYKFRYFFGRDDYNIEHVFRTWELRRRGGMSLGICHGMPSTPIVDPVMRYIDFDIYYVLGIELFRRYYSDTFPPTMTLRQVGSFGIAREELPEMFATKPKNIICFTKPHMDGNAGLDIAVAIANAFPDRKVFVKVKLGVKHYGNYEDFMARLRTAPPNLIYTEEDSYKLMKQARYSLSGISTLNEEALHFGLVAFFLDIYGPDVPVFYRAFPEFCQPDAESVINLINAIECGRWRYPRERYAGIAEISGATIYDVLRHDLGLPPKDIEKRGMA